MKPMRLKIIFTALIGLVFQAAGLYAAPEWGALESVTPQGHIQGRAANPSDPSQDLKVRFYVDGPKGKGGVELFFETVTTLKDSHRFDLALPDSLGDDRTHTLHAYAMVGEDAKLLSGSPLSFSFHAQPKASLVILSPKKNQKVTGKELLIKYQIKGDRGSFRHVHWSFDDYPEHMDHNVNGSYRLPGLTPGPHVLKGYLAESHHEKVLHSDVSVEFVVKEPKKKGQEAPPTR
jgi:hypothetical protein